MKNMLKRIAGNEKGQALTEYGLILVLVAVGVIAVMGAFGSQIKSKIATISLALDGSQNSEITSYKEETQKFATKAKELGSASVNTMSGPDSADFEIE